MSLDSFCPTPQLKETRDSVASPNVRKKWLFKTSGPHYNIRWGPGQEYTGEEVGIHQYKILFSHASTIIVVR